MERTELIQNEDDIDERRGWWNKITGIFGSDEEYIDEEESDGPPAPSRATIRHGGYPRADAGRANAIFVRRSILTIDDAQAVADRLKERRPVVVNFEHTEEDIARSGLDFISGVVYALDGYYEKIGDKVFLFTPTNTPITVDDPDAAERPAYYGSGR